jgi:hypothetical protein
MQHAGRRVQIYKNTENTKCGWYNTSNMKMDLTVTGSEAVN